MYRIPLWLKWKGRFWFWAVERYLMLCLRLLLNLLWGLQVCIARVPWVVNGEERVGGFCRCPWELCRQTSLGTRRGLHRSCAGKRMGLLQRHRRCLFLSSHISGWCLRSPSCWRKGDSCSSYIPCSCAWCASSEPQSQNDWHDTTGWLQKEAPHPCGGIPPWSIMGITCKI